LSLDSFTQRRLIKFVNEFRAKSGTPPTLHDFETGGFAKDLIELAVKENLLEMFYVNLTSGTIVKTYRLKS
jgi:hypothetical protein